MSASTLSFSPTLESVQQAFNDWRARRGKRARTPITLQRQAVRLRGSYLASPICSALKINDVALKRWAAECAPTPPLPSTAAPAALVELPAELLRGHVAAFNHWNGLPRILLYDNLKFAVLERSGDAVRFHPTLIDLATYYRF